MRTELIREVVATQQENDTQGQDTNEQLNITRKVLLPPDAVQVRRREMRKQGARQVLWNKHREMAAPIDTCEREDEKNEELRSKTLVTQKKLCSYEDNTRKPSNRK